MSTWITWHTYTHQQHQGAKKTQGDIDEDDELEIALALSVEEGGCAPPSPCRNDPIVRPQTGLIFVQSSIRVHKHLLAQSYDIKVWYRNMK